MSRSYRKPYGRWAGWKTSVKQDRQIAARNARHSQNQYLRTVDDYEAVLIPHRHECNYNDQWGWPCDGKSHLCRPSWSEYVRKANGLWQSRWDEQAHSTSKIEWPPQWFIKLHRK